MMQQAALKHSALPSSLAPRGLRRAAAAAFFGVSPSKFDEGRREGIIPAPKLFLGVELYCRRELDESFSCLPTEVANDNNPWDV
jgi:hypothetical protein